jgi:hypothetical protein
MKMPGRFGLADAGSGDPACRLAPPPALQTRCPAGRCERVSASRKVVVLPPRQVGGGVGELGPSPLLPLASLPTLCPDGFAHGIRTTKAGCKPALRSRYCCARKSAGLVEFGGRPWRLTVWH